MWTAIDPQSKLLLSVQVGKRTLAMAQAVLHQIAQLVATGCAPLFLSGWEPELSPCHRGTFRALGAAASTLGHRASPQPR